MASFESRKTDIYRFWALSAVQYSAERWCRAILLHAFSSPLLCRHAAIIPSRPNDHNRLEYNRNSQEQERVIGWCVVDGLAYRLPMHVGSPMCVYDSVCGSVVYTPSVPHVSVVMFVVVVSLVTSVLLVWLPRLLIYKTRHRGLAKLQKHCRRALLRVVLSCTVLRNATEMCAVYQDWPVHGTLIFFLYLLVGTLYVKEVLRGSSIAEVLRVRLSARGEEISSIRRKHGII